MRSSGCSKKTIWLISGVVATLIMGLPAKIFGFEAYQIKISAKLHPQEQIFPPPQEQCDTVVIEGVKSVSSLTYRNKTVILKSGSRLIPKLSNINLNVGCDLIIEQGASIDVNGSQDGFIRLIVGRNLILNGKILAISNGTPSSIRVSAGADAVINGEIDVSGTNSAGIIRIDANGKLVINSESIKANSVSGPAGEIRLNVAGDLEINGKLEAKSNEASAGTLRLAINGKIDINGLIDISGVQEGGSIRISSEKDINIKTSGRIDFSALNGNGGTALVDAANDLNINGNVNGNGLNQGGSFIGTISRNGSVKGKITVNSTNIDSGEGGVLALNASQGNLIISGILEAKGARRNGSINLTYCSKDFTSAQFDPLPSETDNCPAIQTLNSQNSSYTPLQSSNLLQNSAVVQNNTKAVIEIGGDLLNYFNNFINK